MPLAKLGRKKLAMKERERYAQACRVIDWVFNERMHGKTGTPLDMAKQSWNAALFVSAAEVIGYGLRRSADCAPSLR
jgi:ATP-dependent protease ClpP protease subunit